MTTADEPYNQVLALAHKLNAHQKAHLIAGLAVELATESPDTPVANDSWARLEAFRCEMELLGPKALNFATQLDEDRQTRQDSLAGMSRILS